ncbi:MAG: flagellar biosynthesis protein FlhB [Aequoribacter sp.]|jgi:flagellar biosynthetic protein FlhB|uniref:flagellar biosynthesis protein FlhB n=1 Tax=Aequoribacter sp. TaxID=2847771 RepID=UPI003C5326A8
MAENESQAEDRTEEPTARRLQKAREEGQVARSQELSIAAMMIGIATTLLLAGPYFFDRLSENFASGFEFDRNVIFNDQLLTSAFAEQALAGFAAVLPIFILTVVIAILAAGLLGGYLFSGKALAPKASKLNPLSGLKRIFGLKALVELTKALSKFLLVGGISYLVISSSLEDLMASSLMDLNTALAHAGSLIGLGFLFVTLSLLVVVAIDVPYQMNEFKKRMKMTKQEIKDEMKETEGRPEVRAQVRQRQREMAMNRMIDAVADADVIITNPEHFAVALAYNPVTDDAPRILAKGADHIAATIREKAKSEGVPLFSAPPLARALFFTTEINESVPESLYYAVAQVIAYIFNLNSVNADGLVHAAPTVDVPEDLKFDSDGNREAQDSVDE